ncbi:hypothetical protein A10D4_13411 [Idiomarina xiamenensis 10-D-4]|uniref:Uncharacterized protein n=1 Tax=Idiomarina xiamenensis 10-D-4 TaxID=740709 RepID=K2JRJ8_9GAMM|nr:hypothetical protein A10D4_13411 [Idiomarina xiamenensis 10-D-4]
MWIHVFFIVIVVLLCLKLSIWVPMLVTLVASFIYFQWLVASSPADGLSGLVFWIWPATYTLLSGALWLLLNRLRKYYRDAHH